MNKKFRVTYKNANFHRVFLLLYVIIKSHAVYVKKIIKSQLIHLIEKK